MDIFSIPVSNDFRRDHLFSSDDVASDDLVSMESDGFELVLVGSASGDRIKAIKCPKVS